MAASGQYFENSRTHNAVGFSYSFVTVRVIFSAINNIVSRAGKRSLSEKLNLYHTFDKTINIRKAITTLFFMFILLLTLQAPVCCDDTVKSELISSSADEQTLKTEVVALAPVNNPVSAPDAAILKDEITRSETTEAVTIKPTRAQAVTIAPSRVETMTSLLTKTSDEAALELPSATPETLPGQSAINTNEDIMANAAATLTADRGAAFVKIANSGDALDDKVDKWECIKDKRSNLIWEVKKNDGGIRDKDHSYSWLKNINGDMDGISNGGRCKGGIRCDTSSYTHAINEQNLCGYSDWRIPSRSELETLVEYKYDSAETTINSKYFPEAVPSWYWSSSENSNRKDYAWYVLFRNGVSLNDLKERPKHIRLVRGRSGNDLL